jgi:beta-glucosidase-like glycosyl hydrolase
VERLFAARFRLGMFDPPERVPYASISIDENDSAEHREVAREAARRAIVLLKNEGGVLPLDPSVRRIAVVGPSADDPVAVLGNYHGISSKATYDLMERLPTDTVPDRMMAEVHYYTPWNFTGMTEDQSWGSQFYY